MHILLSLSILQFVIDFLEKRQHAIDMTTMVVLVILKPLQVTSLLVLCVPTSWWAIYYSKYCTTSNFYWIIWHDFSRIHHETKTNLLYLFGNKAKFKGFFFKIIKMLLQMLLLLKHQITKRIRDVIVVGE